MEETVTRLRSSTRSSFTRAANKIKARLSEELEDADIVELQLLLEERCSHLGTLDEKVMEILMQSEATEDEMDEELKTVEKYREEYLSLKVKLRNRLSKVETTQRLNETVESTSSKRKFKLPEIQLKQFSGDLKGWLSFWAQYEKIHEDPDIPDEDKYQYLIQSTLPGSRAREVVESFPPTADNYAQAIDCLESRFGRKDVLVEVYIRELLSLVMNNVVGHKPRMPLVKLYDKIETYLRSLKMLGVTSEKYSSIIYPLVESSLPIELLRLWERSYNLQAASLGAPAAGSSLPTDGSSGQATSRENKLDALLKFLRREIESEEKVNIANRGFLAEPTSKKTPNYHLPSQEKRIPSAAELFKSSEPKKENRIVCLFCNQPHPSHQCKHAENLSLEERRKIIVDARACFKCIKVAGHQARACRSKVRCPSCKRGHYLLMCSFQGVSESDSSSKAVLDVSGEEKESTNATAGVAALSGICTSQVLLQTLIVRICQDSPRQERKVRVLLDSGSQRSYLSKYAADVMGYKCGQEETLAHTLFGGQTVVEKHKRYVIKLGDLNKSYKCTLEVLDQPKICANIPRIEFNSFADELKQRKIFISDVPRNHEDLIYEKSPEEVHLLIGADVLGKLYTGRVENLKGGLTCVQTFLGWTIMGKTRTCDGNDSTNLALSLHVTNAQLNDLWRLDALGILDPGEKSTKLELEAATREHFVNTLKRDENDRYEVSLPWIEGHPDLPSYRSIAEKRLKTCVNSLKRTGRLTDYEGVFGDWEKEGIIKSIESLNKEEPEHFLPHRAVYKEHSTTPVRPVFDGSVKSVGSPSINDCIYKGPNLVEMIPTVLTRFRLNKIGVTADIRRAFQQISLSPVDRSYLKFLWWEGGNPERLKVFQHQRVVFGITCSPYLLGATLEYHLKNVIEPLQQTASLLLESFYVDNCLTSVRSAEELEKLINESQLILGEAKFDLRGWEHSSLYPSSPEIPPRCENIVPVLGLNWCLREDWLCVSVPDQRLEDEPITKRRILSYVHRIFDPLGFVCAVTLLPKLLLQECWTLKVTWDDVLPDSIGRKFRKWMDQLERLKELKIPRWLSEDQSAGGQYSLHVFCDASKMAYATCIFLRSELSGVVTCRLIQARSRVAPLKDISTSRLELLSCVIGARLAQEVKKDLKREDLECRYWSDSSNVLYYIKKQENYAAFVYNRVKEIRELSDPDDWHHISGPCNPADLPSRGCSVKVLLDSNWHAGPEWLRLPKEQWPKSEVFPDPEVIAAEKRKTVKTALVTESGFLELHERFSSYDQLLRVTAWIRRFINNARKGKEARIAGSLSADEIVQAELAVVKLVQQEFFSGVEDRALRPLRPTVDAQGLLRTQTRVLRRKDKESFRFPIILPCDHPVVEKLIRSRHQALGHAGVHLLMSNLREEFWILKCRKTVKQVVRKCVTCRRFESRNVKVPEPPLPEDRVRDANVFEIVGVDLAGPLILKGGQKCWVVIYTCAIFRAAHFELVTSLSTETFLQSFRRFIARRGRPAIVYSDNATNFTGANNLLQTVDWNKIEKFSSANKITWKFIPPAAPHWGGWWERIVGMLKRILRKVLGRTSLNFEEMYTTICDCESFINNRPLTYLANDVDDLVSLTPSMFLQELKEVGTPDLDTLDAEGLNRRYAYRQRLRSDLRERFRSEYLGQLKQSSKCSKDQPRLKIGEVVIVASDNKRLFWPLGRITAVYPSADGKVRLFKVKVKSGEILRPITKVYPLEVEGASNEDFLRDKILEYPPCLEPTSDTQKSAVGPKRSRYGRVLKPVQRFTFE